MVLKKQLNVFISSTSEDLKEYRSTARLAVSDLGWVPQMMENMGSQTERTVLACLKLLAKCDLVVLLVAFRRGWVPTIEQGGNGTDSITALEFEFAKGEKIPVIIMRASDETWPKKYCDKGNDLDWIENFRAKLDQPADTFDYEDTSKEESKRLPNFRGKLTTALNKFKEEQLDKSAPETHLIEAAKDGLLEKISIPFLGPALFGQDSLGAASLACALEKNMPEDTTCLATVAEYCEKSHGSRELFLKKLSGVIQEQSSHAATLKVCDLILAIKPPPLIVSTTYDLVLEKKLRELKKEWAIVCHVVRSSDAKHDGKILVLRKDKPPQICLADDVDISGVDYTIYKPLGSPLLNDELDKDFQEAEIDTVVITESDHLIFLARLENQHTQVPAKFSRIFQRKSLLFLVPCNS
jgi:nucleoside 2-deoxyribosyltransferase